MRFTAAHNIRPQMVTLFSPLSKTKRRNYSRHVATGVTRIPVNSWRLQQQQTQTQTRRAWRVLRRDACQETDQLESTVPTNNTCERMPRCLDFDRTAADCGSCRFNFQQSNEWVWNWTTSSCQFHVQRPFISLVVASSITVFLTLTDGTPMIRVYQINLMKLILFHVSTFGKMLLTSKAKTVSASSLFRVQLVL